MNDSKSSKGIRFLPVPGKKQAVGFCKFKLHDANRREKKGNRQFEVQVWYPGAVESIEKSVRKEYINKNVIEKLFLLNLRFRRRVNEVKYLKTNSFVELPVSSDRKQYPVVLFSHDIGMMPEYYSALMEHLASEGYFVFSVNHSHLAEISSLTSVDTNKTTTVSVKKWIVALSAFLSYKVQKTLAGKSFPEKWTLSKKVLLSWHALANTNLTAGLDKSFLVTFLEQLNAKFFQNNLPYCIFSNRLDLSRIAVMGHGWGGASAVQMLMKDSRIKAAVNLDGFQFDNIVNSVIDKPLLMIYSEKNASINEGIYFSSAEYETFTISNSRHNSFTDWPYYETNVSELGNQTLYQTLNLVVHFFDKHLKRIDYVSNIQANSR